MISAVDYGYQSTYEMNNVTNIKEDIGLQTKYEVSLMSTINDTYVSIKETGNLELFVDHMLGIKIDKNNHSINVTATDVNINGNTTISSQNKLANIEVSSVENDSFVSQKADYIGINSNISVFIGNGSKTVGSKATIKSDVVEIITNKFIVNGKEIT